MDEFAVVAEAFKACSWGNTSTTVQDWVSILKGTDEQGKRRIFDLLFREDPVEAHIRLLFDAESIARFLSGMNRVIERSWVERRRKVWRFLYCNIREPIPELDWIIPA